ncbi:MAG: diguanylate cyclase, partial [Deltaproteobacteria bacterium]|nr:diguanylate cyclase [Deltaproteobacteria bacterium]
TISVGALLGNQAVSHQGTALIVDNDPKSSSIIRKELVKAAVHANICRSAAELEAFLAVCRPDLIILNVLLPDGRGPDLSKKIRSREELAATAIIVVAEEIHRELMIDCLNNKADDFLIKPFTQEEFKARIGSHLRTKRLHNELAHRNRILESLAYHDGLTGLLNRRYLDEGLKREINSARAGNSSLGFLLIDLDHFKKVNDKYGHQVGDDVLREVSGEIQNVVREMGMACRYGGEEMCVLLPGATWVKAREVAERLRARCEKRRYTIHHIRQTMSIGVSAFPDPSGAESLVTDADAAVYQAKSAGRNQVAVTERIKISVCGGTENPG